jgi:hypothetical protein
MRLDRIDTLKVKEGVQVIFRFREDMEVKSGACKVTTDNEYRIEVTLGSSLGGTRDKLASVVAQLSELLEERNSKVDHFE